MRSNLQDLPTASFGLRQTPRLQVLHCRLDRGGDRLRPALTNSLNALGLDTAILVSLAAATRARIVTASFFHCDFSLKSQVNRSRSRIDTCSRRHQQRSRARRQRGDEHYCPSRARRGRIEYCANLAAV